MPMPAARPPRPDAASPQRWECHCQEPPVLLGTMTASGQVNIKVRDRYWTASRPVSTRCPRCGAEHTLAPLPAAVR